MKKIKTANYDIYFGIEGYAVLGQYLNEKKYSKIIILTDSNCNEHCLPHFLSNLPTHILFEIIEIEPGEEFKNLEIFTGILQTMTELEADRKSVMITVGGGVVSDLGGFVSSVYMRGIDCINIPTTLLAMVDASVGGKTGVDLEGIKNCVGTFSMPRMVVVDTSYLETLNGRQIRAGYAEMLKHGLIYDAAYYDYLKDISNIDFEDLSLLIFHSVYIKNEIVSQDPEESGLRKILNFGHTVGHAIESYFLTQNNKNPLLHGEAVAVGMVIEAYMSTQLSSFSKDDYEDIKKTIHNIYEKVQIEADDIEQILSWIKFDKKNYNGNIYSVLLSNKGKAEYDFLISKDLVIRGFKEYLK